MSRSNFSPSGLNLGNNDTNMVYMYGISDFFSIMFEDTSKVNLVLEGSSEIASDAYSKFLQLTSGISLTDIQTTLNQTIKLITIKSTDIIIGEVNTYRLTTDILESRYIANRPLLPTVLMEQEVDYRIEKVGKETRIRFAKDISNIGFSTRLLKDETTHEYALWFVDTEIDEGWINTNYASLIGVDPEVSTDVFKNFVQGLYQVYLNGPTLDLLRKGLNLCLGIPLARDIETVIDIRKYLETDQYIVITDYNQYVVPYGLSPKVAINDYLSVGDEIAQWVEIKDYIQDGDWWINLRIPQKLIPSVPSGQISRYAVKGSHFDYLMRTYLKKHTFLVNINVENFKNTQTFQQLSDIINKAKPSYTEAIYIWTIPNTDDISVEDKVAMRIDQIRYENITNGIEHFFRNNHISPCYRGSPSFLRYTVPDYVSKLCGTDPYVNGDPFYFQGDISVGFTNPNIQFRKNTTNENAWLSALKTRDQELITTTRNKISFSRSVNFHTMFGSVFTGKSIYKLQEQLSIVPEMRIVPLYITTQADLKNKCDIAGIFTPNIKQWSFQLLSPTSISNAINDVAINDSNEELNPSLLVRYFNLFTRRGSEVYYLSSKIPEVGLKNFSTSINDITSKDYLIGIRIHDDILGIYLVTANNPVSTGMYSVMYENDELNMSFTTNPTRGLGPTSSSYYLIRGRGNLDYNNSMSGINTNAINATLNTGSTLLTNVFSDSVNPSQIIMNRGGMSLNHRTELK